MAFMELLLGFLFSLVISAIIIYLAAKLFGEKEGFGTALMVAVIGSVIYTLTYYFIGIGFVAAMIGGLAWLITLGSLYSMGWLKSLAIAVVVWFFATIVGLFLPTLAGPL